MITIEQQLELAEQHIFSLEQDMEHLLNDYTELRQQHEALLKEQDKYKSKPAPHFTTFHDRARG